MAKEEKDYFELGFDAVVAEANRYLAEKAKSRRRAKKMESKAEEMIERNFRAKRKALKLLLEAAKLLEQTEREEK